MLVFTPISGYPFNPAGYTNITPFTVRNAVTFQVILEELRDYITNTVVPESDAKFEAVYKSVGEGLDETIKLINDTLEAQTGNVNAEIKDVRDDVTEAIRVNNLDVANNITQLKADVKAIVDEINEGGAVLQDPIMKQIINNVDSVSRIALNALYQAKGTVDDGAVKALFDTNTATRQAADDRYFRATGATLDVDKGGTGRATSDNPNAIVTGGTTATGPQKSIRTGAAGTVLFGQGEDAAASFGPLVIDSDVNTQRPWSAKKTFDTFASQRSKAGTLAARPAASTVADGVIYATTDTLELYRANGANWQLIGGSGGELAYAERVAAFATPSGSRVDIPGLAITFTVGRKPVWIEFGANIKTDLANSAVILYAVIDGVVVQTAGVNSVYYTAITKARRMTFAEGSVQTVKLAINGGGNLNIDASDVAPAYISAVTR